MKFFKFCENFHKYCLESTTDRTKSELTTGWCPAGELRRGNSWWGKQRSHISFTPCAPDCSMEPPRTPGVSQVRKKPLELPWRGEDWGQPAEPLGLLSPHRWRLLGFQGLLFSHWAPAGKELSEPLCSELTNPQFSVSNSCSGAPQLPSASSVNLKEPCPSQRMCTMCTTQGEPDPPTAPQAPGFKGSLLSHHTKFSPAIAKIPRW